jgi:hypothetical protein
MVQIPIEVADIRQFAPGARSGVEDLSLVALRRASERLRQLELQPEDVRQTG